MPLGFNRVCNLEDFADAELGAIIREIFPAPPASPAFPVGFEEHKLWEVAMAVRALRAFDVLRPDAALLGMAAGTEPTSFFLADHCRQVFITDRYAGAGEWTPNSPVVMLTAPEAYAMGPFDHRRIVAQHMDGRALRFPDDTFDGIFSSGSIEHFGEFDDVAQAAYELGRVLKPGGILTLATVAFVTGPPGHIGWPYQTLVFSPEHVQRYLIDACGLELVDEIDFTVSERSRQTARDLTQLLGDSAREPRSAGLYPQILLEHDGVGFTSLFLTLRKTKPFPAVDNRWAAPRPATRDAVREYNRAVVNVPRRPAPMPHRHTARLLDAPDMFTPARGSRTGEAPLALTKVAAIEDFRHPELSAVIRDLFQHKATNEFPGYPVHFEDAADWREAMAVRALARRGVIRRDADVLVLSMRAAATIFFLTWHIGRVFAADQYAVDHADPAMRAMLVDPSLVAPYSYDEARLVVQAAPPAALRVPDASFDGVIATPAIDFSDLETLEAPMREVARVLKPGGIASVVVPIIASAAADTAVTGLPALTWAQIERHVVGASGLTLVDEADLTLTPSTASSAWSWRGLTALGARVAVEGAAALDGRPLRSFYPQVALEHEGVVFVSVHLTLMRPTPAN